MGTWHDNITYNKTLNITIAKAIALPHKATAFEWLKPFVYTKF